MNWTKNVLCRNCGTAGLLELTRTGHLEAHYDVIPTAFKLGAGLFGNDIHCATCDIPVVPTKSGSPSKPISEEQAINLIARMLRRRLKRDDA